MPQQTSYTVQIYFLYPELTAPTNGTVFVVHLPVNQQVSLRVAMDVIPFENFGRLGEETLLDCHAGDGFTVLKGDCSVRRPTRQRDYLGINASWVDHATRLKGRGDCLDPHRGTERPMSCSGSHH